MKTVAVQSAIPYNPRNMAQTILGIDIGSHSVKLALVERAFNEFRILQFIEHPLSLQTRLPHEELIALALEQVFKNYDLRADVVSTSYPGHLLSSRVLDFPFVNHKKLNQVLEFELENYVPFAMEDIIFDFHVLNREEAQAQILCLYLQQEKFAKYLECFSRAGVDPKYFGADLTDFSGIANIAMVPQNEYYAICDIGHSKTNLLVMRGTELKYARSIGIGGLHFTRAIQRAFNVNSEKAESLKISRGKLHVREQDTDQISRNLNHVGAELVSSIKQTFLGFDNIFGHHPICAIYCTGGSSKLGGLLDYLSFHLRANVLELDSLNMVSHNLEDTAEASKIMTQALANALRPIFSNRFPQINFRKGIFSFKQDIQVLTSELKNVGVMLSVIFILGLAYYFYAGHYYAKKMAAIDAKVEKIIDAEFPDLKDTKRRGSGGKSLAKYLSLAQKKLDELKNQKAAFSGESGVPVLAVMQEVSDKLPMKSDVKFEVSEFNYSDNFVRLTGRTDDPLNVAKIVAALKTSTYLANIESSDPQAKPGNFWDFTMKINLKDSETESPASPSKGAK